jgi:proteasome lid subunit RPN8/RPN11
MDETTKVPQRIELDLERPPVLVSTTVMHELRSHALQAHPEECCGLVTGTPDQPFRTVYRCTNVMTRMHLSDPEAFPRDARHAYYMSEIEYLKTQKECERLGEGISAIYHSHVGAGAYLSDDDLKFAEHVLFPFPQAAQIVLGVWDGAVQAEAIFVRPQPLGDFVGHPVAVEG